MLVAAATVTIILSSSTTQLLIRYITGTLHLATVTIHISRFGAPQQVLPDLGPEFES